MPDAKADTAKTDDAQDPAPVTEQEAEDTGLLTPKRHMQMIEEQNKRVDEEREAARHAQIEAAQRTLRDDAK